MVVRRREAGIYLSLKGVGSCEMNFGGGYPIELRHEGKCVVYGRMLLRLLAEASRLNGFVSIISRICRIVSTTWYQRCKAVAYEIENP